MEVIDNQKIILWPKGEILKPLNPRRFKPVDIQGCNRGRPTDLVPYVLNEEGLYDLLRIQGGSAQRFNLEELRIKVGRLEANG